MPPDAEPTATDARPRGAAIGPSALAALLPPGLLLVAGFGALLACQPVSRQPLAALAAWSVACAGWGLAVRAVARLPRSARSSGPALALLVVVALALRLAAVPAPPGDDVHRYLWEARVVLSGANPYALAPNAPELAALAAGDADRPRVNHPGWPAIYPPLQQCLQAGVVAVHDSAGALKLTWIVAEAVLAWLLAAELRRRGRSPLGLVVLLWCPLAVLVGALEGHHDVVAATLLVAALVALGRRPRWAPLLFGLAVMAKPFALAALPALLPSASRGVGSAVGARPGPWAWTLGLAAAALPALPFVLDGGGLLTSLGAFGRELHTGDVLPHVLAWVVGRPSSTALCALLGLGLGLLVWHAGPSDPWRRAAILLGGLLLLLPTVHLWYPMILLPLLVLFRWPGWLWVVAAGPLTWLTWLERGASGPWTEWPALKLVIWLPLGVWLGHRAWRARTSRATPATPQPVALAARREAAS